MASRNWLKFAILLNWFWVDILDMLWHWCDSILVLTRCDFYSTSPEDASFTKPGREKEADIFRRHFFGLGFSDVFPKTLLTSLYFSQQSWLRYIHLKVQKVKTKRKSEWLFCYGHWILWGYVFSMVICLFRGSSVLLWQFILLVDVVVKIDQSIRLSSRGIDHGHYLQALKQD